MTENELKHAVLRIARLNGWMQYNQPQRAMRSAGDHGFPDLVLARGGRAVFMELKTEVGLQTALQHAWSQELPNYHLIRPRDLASGLVNEVLA